MTSLAHPGHLRRRHASRAHGAHGSHQAQCTLNVDFATNLTALIGRSVDAISSLNDVERDPAPAVQANMSWRSAASAGIRHPSEVAGPGQDDPNLIGSSRGRRCRWVLCASLRRRRWGWRRRCLLGGLLGGLLCLIGSGLLSLGLVGGTLLRSAATRSPHNADNKQHKEDHHSPLQVAIFGITSGSAVVGSGRRRRS